MKKTFWAVFSWFKRKQAWLGLEEADSSHFFRYLCNEYHVSSQLITEQGLSNDSESMRLQWQDTPGRNWEEGKNFRWEHLLLLWGIRKPRSTFSSCLKPNPDPIWVPKDSIFHCQESWRKRRLSSFFQSVPSVWQGNEVLAYWSWWYCIKIFCCCIHLDPEFPQFPRTQLHHFCCNFLPLKENSLAFAT